MRSARAVRSALSRAGVQREPLAGGGTRRMVKASGTASARMRAAPASMAVAKPLAAATRTTSAGTITTPLKLAPLRARLMASPRRCWNHRPRMLLMAPRLMVAQPKDMTR